MKPKAIKLFLWCLKEAQFQDYDYKYGSKIVRLKKGQLLATLRGLSQKTHLTYWETRRNLVCIKYAGLLQGFVQGSYQILTIINYDSYINELFKPRRPVASEIASGIKEKQQPISNNISIYNTQFSQNSCGNCGNYTLESRHCKVGDINLPPTTSSLTCPDFKAKEPLESEVQNGSRT